jgi:hypothetical protein
VTPEEAAELQRKYRQKRMRWARAINRPYSTDIEKPDPGALDAAEEDNG